MAVALRDWLPSVIQALEPWMSESDIAKGAGWDSEITKHLELAKIGIICLTPGNLHAPWVNFEAGALSKLTGSRVCPYLLGISPTDVTGPLSKFQMTNSNDKGDTKKLLHTINDNLGEQRLKDPQLDIAFEMWWPKLHEVLEVIPAAPAEDKRAKRTTEELLEEILQLAREQDKKSDMTLQALTVRPATGALEQLLVGRNIPRFGFRGDMISLFPSVVEPGTGSLLINAADSVPVSAEEVAQISARRAQQNTAAIVADTATKKKDGEQ